MGKDIVRRERAVCDELHPRVYQALVGLVLWLMLAAALLLAGWPDTELMLGVVAGFLLIFTAIPLALWSTWRKASGESRGGAPSLRDWAASEFVVWGGTLRGSEAAAQVLLPIAALAVGLTAFGLVARFTLG